jgi:hypothetical protein
MNLSICYIRGNILSNLFSGIDGISGSVSGSIGVSTIGVSTITGVSSTIGVSTTIGADSTTGSSGVDSTNFDLETEFDLTIVDWFLAILK